jgi:hypothetical protein
MTATVVAHRRHTFGLDRLIYVVRCPNCRAKTEVRYEHLANALSRAHVCALHPTEVKP